MKNIIRQLLVFFVFVVSLNLAAQTLPVITGQVKCQGRGVANVVVTNGFDCVSTDVAGKYTIPYHRDARFVYVTALFCLPQDGAYRQRQGIECGTRSDGA